MARRTGKTTIAKYLAKKHNMPVIVPSVPMAKQYTADGIQAVYARRAVGMSSAIIDDIGVCLSLAPELMAIQQVAGFTARLEAAIKFLNKRELVPPEAIEYMYGQHAAFMRGYIVVPR